MLFCSTWFIQRYTRNGLYLIVSQMQKHRLINPLFYSFILFFEFHYLLKKFFIFFFLRVWFLLSCLYRINHLKNEVLLLLKWLLQCLLLLCVLLNRSLYIIIIDFLLIFSRFNFIGFIFLEFLQQLFSMGFNVWKINFLSIYSRLV